MFHEDLIRRQQLGNLSARPSKVTPDGYIHEQGEQRGGKYSFAHSVTYHLSRRRLPTTCSSSNTQCDIYTPRYIPKRIRKSYRTSRFSRCNTFRIDRLVFFHSLKFLGRRWPWGILDAAGNLGYGDIFWNSSGESQAKGVCDHGEKRKEVESGEDLRACWKAAVGPSWEMDSWLSVGEEGRIKFDTKRRCYWRSKMGGGLRRGGGGDGGAEGDDKGQEEKGALVNG